MLYKAIVCATLISLCAISVNASVEFTKKDEYTLSKTVITPEVRGTTEMNITQINQHTARLEKQKIELQQQIDEIDAEVTAISLLDIKEKLKPVEI